MDILQEALTQGITSAIIIAVYLVIVKIIDTRKENNQAKINSKLVDSISKISSYNETQYFQFDHLNHNYRQHNCR